MNRLITILITILAFAWSQASTDGWYKFPLLNDEIDDMVEVTNKVYYLSGGTLFSFSPDDNEAYAYSNLNKLTGSTITGIYYNYDSKYLAIAYDDANIDILYDNGKVLNLPDIRDAQFTDTKSINDITFGDGYIVVATNFGVVIYREDKMEVKESSIFDTNIRTAAVRGGILYINYQITGGHYLFWAKMDERHNSLDKFSQIGGFYSRNYYFIDDNNMFIVNDANGRLYTAKLTRSTNRVDTYNFNSGAYVTSKIYQCPDGYYAYNDSIIFKFQEVSVAEEIKIPDALRGNTLAFRDTPTELWAGDASGVGQYDISGSTPTVLYDRISYNDGTTCSPVGYMRWSVDGNRLYISNLTASGVKAFATSGDYINMYQKTNIIENGYAIDASLKNASASTTSSINLQTKNNNTRMYGDPAWMIEDPNNPDIYYIANNHEGLYVVKRNETTGEYEELVKFTSDNSPITSNSGYRCEDVNIDPHGNLWVGHMYGTSYYCILPAAKRIAGIENVGYDDWIEHPTLGDLNIDYKDMMSLFCQKSNMMFMITGRTERGIVAIDTKGTYDDPSDDTVVQIKVFTDQDGDTFSASRTTFLLEDNRGCVWVGTTSGVFEIADPTKVTDPDFTVRRIKVPRNDGTNYADYLLDTDIVYWMSEDHSGRKWIATEVSGLFLVSETGDEIIQNYTTDNSPLPSNMVCSVECDPYSNTVYVGTPAGLYSFLSDSSPAQSDYSEICAYPNPVRPEFYGDVKITGLMEDSIVKIADVSGNVVAQMRSEGGMATWNVCNLAGKRVRSGVYYVYATSSDDTTSSGAVTKILVIN